MATKGKHITDAHVNLLMAYLNKNGGIVRKHDAMRIYGNEVVAYALEHHHCEATAIRAKDKTNTVPTVRIEVIHTKEWNGEKPIWL